MKDYIDRIIGRKTLDKEKVQGILDESLLDKDFFCLKSRNLLTRMGLEKDETLMLLAFHKSKIKYGYDLSLTSLTHLLSLAKKKEYQVPLQKLFESPFLLIKACWIYEHAPYFFFYDANRSKDIDAHIMRFANFYHDFLQNKVSTDKWEKRRNPKKVIGVTFWENQIIDPVFLIEKAMNEGIEGIELSIDFHPFNYTRLLPEELSKEKRVQIREACRKTGMRIDIHSPIVGPYAPFPNPGQGKQLFFNPLDCFELMCETIDLAQDIGAGSVVIHIIDTSNIDKMIALIIKATGSDVRVTLENYCQTKTSQTSNLFIAYIDKICKALPKAVRDKNFGITLDVGHLNIEGDDPLIASEKIGHWCLINDIFLRLHATDNYGKLLFSPPVYSADVHSNVSGRGINNAAIIKLLRCMGHQFDVVAEQIQPLNDKDIALLHESQTFSINNTYENYVFEGKKKLSRISLGPILTPETLQEEAYLFLAGLEGVSALKEYLIYRRIQDKKYLSVDEVQKISQTFMKMPKKFKNDLAEYIDDLLLPIQDERGAIQKNELDLICQNISGALFGTINNEHLDQIFSQTKTYKKGEVICEQNTPGQEMYLVMEGEVTVLINGSTLASLGLGEIFGEISLFYNVKRTATVQASQDETRVGVLTRSGLESLLKNSRPHSHDLIFRLYNILPERLRNLNNKYKTAINALNLIKNEAVKKMPRLNHFQQESKLKTSLFPILTQEEAQTVFQKTMAFDAGQFIFAEGDRGDGAYLLLGGKANAITFSENYEEIILGELSKNEIFGEMALIDENPRSASIVTITPCEAAFASKTAFNQFIETRSDLAFRLMAFICLSLFNRILRLDKIYADIRQTFNQTDI